jgi:hypothetical protein
VSGSRSQSFQQAGAGDGTHAAADGDARGVHTFVRRDDRPQRGGRAQARHRYHDNEFVTDAGEYLIDGNDDGGAMFAGLAGAGGAEGDQPQVASARFRQGRHRPFVL